MNPPASRLNPLHVAEAASTRRNLGLDLLRVIAIGMVVVCHAIELLPPSTLGILVYWWTGFLGVELFYVLSGYLIGSILLEICQQHAHDISLRKHLPDFLIRRWFRTLPNYYLFLLLDLIFNAATRAQLPRYLVFCQNLAWPMGTMMPISWSLAIEEWFYLTFPLLLILCLKLWRRPARAFALACATYIGLFYLLRALALTQPGLDWDAGMRKVVLYRLDSIAYGALIMLLMRCWPQRLRKLQHLLFLLGLGGVAYVTWQLTQMLYGAPPSAAFFSLTGLSFACCLPLAVHQSENAGASRPRQAIATISIISYSIYLLHTSIALRLVYAYLRGAHWGWQITAYLTLTLLLSLLTYNLYERPMTALRNRFTRKTAIEL